MPLIPPRTPPGTLELLPREQRAFQHMLEIIRRSYESFGFLPVETPVFEMRDVLLTKSGGETEKQVYFVQSTGSLQQGHAPDLALRFDLTVPLARYVAEHERELSFPFRRYQIQRVYRGERAQRGRFREFYQCDIDVIGKDRLDPAHDAEIPAIIAQIFTELKVSAFTIHFSNRKILQGLLAGMGIDSPETRGLMLREIDKLDKTDAASVRARLEALGLKETGAESLLGLLTLKADKDALLARLQAEPTDNALFREGVAEVAAMVAALRAMGVPEERTRLNLAIARGLDYYTGAVYETVIDAYPKFGSVCSGGRYDDLASHYTKAKLPGVGISIGATRLFELLRTNNLLLPTPPGVQVLVTCMEPERRDEALALAAELRRAGLAVEAWLEPAKLDRQLKHADRTGIPYAVLVGPDERAQGAVVLKDLARKEQQTIPREALTARLKEMAARAR